MSSDIKVIDKAFKIIGCFDEKNKSASLKQIALITKLNKSTIIRICRSLIKHEFLVKNEIDGNIYPNFDTFKNKARKNPNLNVYGKQFTKEYGENSITEIQEFIGNSRNIK